MKDLIPGAFINILHHTTENIANQVMSCHVMFKSMTCQHSTYVNLVRY